MRKRYISESDVANALLNITQKKRVTEIEDTQGSAAAREYVLNEAALELEKFNVEVIAKILSELDLQSLRAMCESSKRLHKVCKDFKLMERFDNGVAYGCGIGENGRLGNGSSDFHITFTPIPIQMPNNLSVIQVACATHHTIFLCEDKQAYACGNAERGALGIGNNAPDVVARPTRVVFPEQTEVVYVACGETHSLFLTDNGDVYACGDGEHGRLGDGDATNHITFLPQQMIMPNNTRVTQVAAGLMNSVCLGIDGGIYCCGNNSMLDLPLPSNSRLTLLRMPNDLRVTQISCGRENYMFVGVDRCIYSYGIFELTSTTTFYFRSPTKIEMPENTYVTQVRSCENYAIIIATNGTAYIYGTMWILASEYRNSRLNTFRQPEPLNDPKVLRIVSVACGPNNAILIDNNGDAFGYGNIDHGRLGYDSGTPHFVNPQLYNFMLHRIRRRVAMAACGWYHTIFLSPYIPPSKLPLNLNAFVCSNCNDPSPRVESAISSRLLYCDANCAQEHWTRSRSHK